MRDEQKATSGQKPKQEKQTKAHINRIQKQQQQKKRPHVTKEYLKHPHHQNSILR